jgi:hypothetical protein
MEPDEFWIVDEDIERLEQLTKINQLLNEL